MDECKHPFIVNLQRTFKDKNHVYMLLDLVLGGELFTYLQVGSSTPQSLAPIPLLERMWAGRRAGAAGCM